MQTYSIYIVKDE